MDRGFYRGGRGAAYNRRVATTHGEAAGGRRVQAWTTRSLLEWMTRHFAGKSIDSPRVVAEMLLSHVLGCERLRLYMEADRPAQALELATLRGLVERAARHEPAQYLVGHAWFFGARYEVGPAVMIPRSCTETLVDHVVRWCRAAPGHAAPLLADVGTGSGCIAVSLAKMLPGARVTATDVSRAALDVARRNAEAHGAEDRIDFREGPGLEALDAAPCDAICSNPPYISDAQWPGVAPNVREYEPAGALRGGADGLDVIRGLVAGAPGRLKPGGRLAIEIGHGQQEVVLALAEAAGLVNASVLKDHEGLWRVLVAER
jgi:release factor glutamine methyltransferase